MRARPLVIGGAALITGCSLIYASDLDDARGVVIILADASSSSGSSEASANDGGASTDADASPEASIPTGCATYQPAPKFCEDFDGNGGLAGWQVQDELGQSGTQMLTSFSPPWAAKVVMHNGAGICHYDRMQRSFNGIGAKRVTASFRLRLQSPWPNGMAPFVIDLFTETDYCAGLLYINSTDGKASGADINVQSGSAPDDVVHIDGFPSTDDWTDVTINATALTGGGATFEITFKDPDGFSLTTKHDFLQCPVWNGASIHMGVHCDHREATMFYDDIRVDWE